MRIVATLLMLLSTENNTSDALVRKFPYSFPESFSHLTINPTSQVFWKEIVLQTESLTLKIVFTSTMCKYMLDLWQ